MKIMTIRFGVDIKRVGEVLEMLSGRVKHLDFHVVEVVDAAKAESPEAESPTPPNGKRKPPRQFGLSAKDEVLQHLKSARGAPIKVTTIKARFEKIGRDKKNVATAIWSLAKEGLVKHTDETKTKVELVK